MAAGWAHGGAVLDQIADTVTDGVGQADRPQRREDTRQRRPSDPPDRPRGQGQRRGSEATAGPAIRTRPGPTGDGGRSAAVARSVTGARR